MRKLIPQLWDGEKDFFRLYNDPNESNTIKIHATLHLGMLDKPREAFRLERNAFKGDYELPDVDGERPNEDDKTGGGTWKDVPEKLSTDLNLDSIYKNIAPQLQVNSYDPSKSLHSNTLSKDANVIISEDPQRFVCGYIYFSSLAEVYNRNDRKDLLHARSDRASNLRHCAWSPCRLKNYRGYDR